jgi:hypothetical protein
MCDMPSRLVVFVRNALLPRRIPENTAQSRGEYWRILENPGEFRGEYLNIQGENTGETRRTVENILFYNK